MQRKIFPIKRLALASLSALALSGCATRDADVAFLPAPPAELVADQKGDPRPVYPADGLTSEDAHETWVSDALDWGDRRDILALRWCQLYAKFASEPVECGG